VDPALGVVHVARHQRSVAQQLIGDGGNVVLVAQPELLLDRERIPRLEVHESALDELQPAQLLLAADPEGLREERPHRDEVVGEDEVRERLALPRASLEIRAHEPGPVGDAGQGEPLAHGDHQVERARRPRRRVDASSHEGDLVEARRPARVIEGAREGRELPDVAVGEPEGEHGLPLAPPQQARHDAQTRGALEVEGVAGLELEPVPLAARHQPCLLRVGVRLHAAHGHGALEGEVEELLEDQELVLLPAAASEIHQDPTGHREIALVRRIAEHRAQHAVGQRPVADASDRVGPPGREARV
jgi:hypothetical protein